MTTFKHLLIEREGAIAWVKFNRPKVANALNYDHLTEIEAACLSFKDDVESRVVIFTGIGKHFSSGADLTESDPTPRSLLERQRRTRQGERTINAIYQLDQISIAAWNGAAMGGGACVATACDFRVGADDCFMQYPEIDIGMNLMWQSLPLLIHLVGPARGKRLVVGGDRIHAAELANWGVLDAIVPLSELLPRAQDMANHYANKAPIAAQMIKRSVNRIVSALDQSIMHMDADQNLFTAQTDDRAAAISAYLEGTEPKFEGN